MLGKESMLDVRERLGNLQKTCEPVNEIMHQQKREQLQANVSKRE